MAMAANQTPSANAGFDLFDEGLDGAAQNAYAEPSEYIVDIREYDVPYHVRLAIDKGMFQCPLGPSLLRMTS